MTVPEFNQQAGSQRRTYRRDIDGLRAIAILAVVLFHAGIPIFRGGFVGVDVFFVISGYLIGAHVYADIRQGKFRILDFYRSRARRILPALLVVIGLCEIAGLWLLSPDELTMLSRYCIATLGSAANILAWARSGYFFAGADQNPLLMAWSLGVEEQFYIVFPVLMLLIARLPRRWLLLFFAALVAASLALCRHVTLRDPVGAFYLLPSRAWELAAGVLLAIYEDGRDLQDLYGRQKFSNALALLGAALLGFSIFHFNQQTVFPGLAAAIPTLGSVLLIASSSSYFNRIVLGSAPLVFIGRVSYSFYLWHWPLLSFAHIISYQPISPLAGTSIVAVSFLLACASYRWIEQPFRGSPRLAIPLLARYAALCCALGAPAVVIYLAKGFPRRFPQAAQVEVDNFAENAAYDCAGGDAPLRSLACANPNDPRPAVVLWGDSHAAAIAPAVVRIADQQGFKVTRMTKYFCPPVLGISRTQDSENGARECIAYNAEAIKEIVDDAGVRTVVLAGCWGGPGIDQLSYITAKQIGTIPSESASEANLKKALHDTILQLHQAGKQVVIVQDVPYFTFDPARRLISDHIPLRSYLAHTLFRAQADTGYASPEQTYLAPQRTYSTLVQDVASSMSVPVFDPTINLCSARGCSYLAGNIPLYRDSQHLTVPGANLALTGFQFPKESLPPPVR